MYIVNKILLYRPHTEEFKILSKCISEYEYWFNSNRMSDISFKKYYFNHVKCLSQNEQIQEGMDINYVYDWLLNTYSLANYYTKKEAYEDLCNDYLTLEFQGDHYDYETEKVKITISVEKLRKYLMYSKDKLIKNHFKEFSVL